jgi:hypothetical protein
MPQEKMKSVKGGAKGARQYEKIKAQQKKCGKPTKAAKRCLDCQGDRYVP